jgi:hypothetical protein
MWVLVGCHSVVPPEPPAPAPVEASAFAHYLRGVAAAELGDRDAVTRAARWMLLLDPGPWTGLHAAELLAAVGAPPTEAVDRVVGTVDSLPPCAAVAVLDALAAVAPDPRVAPLRAVRWCP